MKGLRKRKLKVLCLDDDPVFRKVLDRVARKMGISVTSTSSIDGFKQMLKAGTHECVLIDYYLDDAVGTEILELVQKTPVIVISAKSDWIRELHRREEEPPTFVHKKFGAKRILEAAIDLILDARIETVVVREAA